MAKPPSRTPSSRSTRPGGERRPSGERRSPGERGPGGERRASGERGAANERGASNERSIERGRPIPPPRQRRPTPAWAKPAPAPANPMPRGEGEERIAKLLARAGIASRREVERMIAEGRVKRGEEVIATPATLLRSLKGITVDGRAVSAPEPTRLFAFHKPSGLLTAERDPAGRPTIYTALRNALPAGTPRLMPVGRLDLNTEGLLLLTNDGELKRALELPSSGVTRTYRARTFGDITQDRLEELMEGIEIDGVRYGSIDANMERRTGRNQWVELTLTEGKNREVRRVLEHLGLQVSRLLRVAYGPFHLGDLPRGQAVAIRQIEVERLRKSLRSGKGANTPAAIPADQTPQAKDN
ncbi:MAG TPA: pseudouridine synthase [Novosphingobium sp.]|nr:pseudouridine synthase [Novosphingobium sp.]HZV11196.1 pseudouridine synthase [Novosphingobium sp.]